jgi:hypothetical protein
MKITTSGIDVAKSVFQVHGVDERGSGENIAAVALAAKHARILWALMVQGESSAQPATIQSIEQPV